MNFAPSESRADPYAQRCRTKYCGHVSPQTFKPRAAPGAISPHLGAGNMEDLDRLIHELGQRYGTVNGLALRSRLGRPCVIFRARGPIRDQLRGAPVMPRNSRQCHDHPAPRAPGRWLTRAQNCRVGQTL